MDLLIKKATHADFIKSLEAPKKTRGRTAGGWIADIAASKQVITLCPLCTHKFNPARVGYRKEKEFPVCVATCDGCGTLDFKCSCYIYAELYSQVRSTAEERRGLAKWRDKAMKKGSLEWKP